MRVCFEYICALHRYRATPIEAVRLKLGVGSNDPETTTDGYYVNDYYDNCCDAMRTSNLREIAVIDIFCGSDR